MSVTAAVLRVHFMKGVDTLNPHLKNTERELFQMDNVMQGVARRMGSRMLLMGMGLVSVAGQAVALTAAIWPLVGALGAIPAVTVAGIAGIATMILGFHGLGAAMKKTGSGAGNMADQISAAERRVEMAQRSARDAQDALNDARERAADRIRDEALAYQQAQLDVKEAALGVRDAQRALKEARQSGDADRIKHAELALARARLDQQRAINAQADAEQEHAKVAEDASKTVRDATERQADALYELAEAQKALAKAGSGGGGGKDAYGKLADSAKRLVDTMKDLGVVWAPVQRQIQQNMFEGLDQSLKRLSGVYLPVMMRQLPAIATGWNAMFKSMSDVASSADFVDDMDSSLGLMATMWQRVGQSFDGFLSGFRHWVAIGSDFMPRLGSWVERLSVKWDNWSRQVRESGRGFDWINNALVVGHQLNELFGAWGRNLFRIVQLGQDPGLLDRMIEGSRAFGDFLHSAEGTARITKMWSEMREVGSALWVVVKNIADLFSRLDLGGFTLALETLNTALGMLKPLLPIINTELAIAIPVLVGLKTVALASAIAVGILRVTFKDMWNVLRLLVPQMDTFGAVTLTKTKDSLKALTFEAKFSQAAMSGMELSTLASGRAMKLTAADAAKANAAFEMFGLTARAKVGESLILTTAELQAMNTRIAAVTAKTALAAAGMMALSAATAVMGYQMFKSGGTTEGLILMAVSAVSAAGSLATAAKATKAMIVALKGMNAALIASRVASIGAVAGFAAIAAAAAYFAFTSKVTTDLGDLSSELRTLVETGKQTGKLKAYLTMASGGFYNLSDSLKAATQQTTFYQRALGTGGASLGNKLKAAFSRELAKQIDDTLSAMIEGGTDAGVAMQNLRDAIGAENVETMMAAGLLPQLSSALEQAKVKAQANADAAQGVSEGYQAALESAQGYADFVRGQTDKVFAYTEAIKDQADAQATATEAQNEATEAQEDYDDAVRRHGPNSQQAQQALERLKAATQGVTDAQKEATDAALRAMYAASDLAAVNRDELVKSLYAAQQQGFLTSQQVQQIITDFDNAREAVKRADGVSATVHLYEKVSATGNDVLSGFLLWKLNHREKGGPVKEGEPYLVGEKGPEIFTPSQSGQIIPNGAAMSTGGTALGSGGAQQVVVTLDFAGASDELARWLKKLFRVNGPKAFGLASA